MQQPVRICPTMELLISQSCNKTFLGLIRLAYRIVVYSILAAIFIYF